MPLLTALQSAHRAHAPAAPAVAVPRRIAIDVKPISPATSVATYAELEPFVQIIDQQSQAAAARR